jgi:hypothetical protein
MKRVELRWLAVAGAVVMGAGLIAPARAQDADDLQRAVGRISLMDGDVSVRRGDSGDWVAGVINAPLIADDRIAAGPNSRAEVELDASNVLYMGGTSEIHLTALEYGRYQMELAHGTITYRILRPGNVNVEVDTPSISVRPSKVGTYRITVNDNGETEVEVRAGDLEVFTPRGSQWVSTGQMLVARGSASDPEFQIVSANPYDDWDRWVDSRSAAITQSQSNQYVPQGVYGAEDLDQNGSWVDYPDYGYVWRPTVPVGWAPYSNGRWAWEDWYGWTWVSYDPWGWAPFHYGRWFWGANYGWCWYPGVIGVRHYWSPGLVAFFGYGGGGFGVGFGFGHVGWVPLAPYEVFHPWWGRGFYGREGFNHYVSVTNVNITNVYRNARVVNGVSAVAANDFREGRFNNVIRPGGDQLRGAGVIHGAMPLTPGTGAVHFANRQASYVPRATPSGQRFFTHQQPPGVQHAPVFEQQRAANFGNRGPSAAGAGPAMARPQGGGAAPAPSGGWRRFGQSEGVTSVAPRADTNSSRGGQTPNGGNGLQRFGEPGNGNRSYPGPSSAPRYSAPPAQNDRPSYGNQSPRYQESTPRYEQQAPRYNAPAPRSEAPRYNAPAPAPRSEAPRYSAPAPRSSGGGGGGSRPSGGGGGGGHSSGGGGGHRR